MSYKRKGASIRQKVNGRWVLFGRYLSAKAARATLRRLREPRKPAGNPKVREKPKVRRIHPWGTGASVLAAIKAHEWKRIR